MKPNSLRLSVLFGVLAAAVVATPAVAHPVLTAHAHTVSAHTHTEQAHTRTISARRSH